MNTERHCLTRERCEVVLPSARAWKSVWAGAAVLILFTALPVFGGTITVTNTEDSGPGSLRAAIASAASGDTINFSLTLPATITVSTALTIDSSGSKSLTISGPGAGSLAISGGDSVPVFVIQPLAGLGGPVIATISGVTIEKGSSLLGGGIFNAGTLTLNNTTVSGNGNSPGTQLGGGIFNAGTLTLNNSTVSFNGANPSSATAGLGGGIYNLGTLTLNHSRVTSNSAFGPFPSIGRGGGIYNSLPGTVTLIDSTVSNNSTRFSIEGGLFLGGGYGGGIYNDRGIVTLTKSAVLNNFSGGGPTGIPLSGAGIANDGGHIFLTNSTVAGNHTPASGGSGAGFSNSGNLSLSNSTVSGNSASSGGGGIGNGPGAVVTREEFHPGE